MQTEMIVSYINKFKDLFEGKVSDDLVYDVVQSIALNDPAHNLGHVYGVCELAKDLCRDNGLSERQTLLVYLGAFLHDIGCRLSRDDHHIVGYGMVYVILDKWCRGMFTPFEVKAIATAVLEHRSSSKQKPSNLISQIVSVADSGEPNVNTYIRRALQFRISRGDLERLDNDKIKLFEEVKEHLIDKFGSKTGYHWVSYPEIGHVHFKEKWDFFCWHLKKENEGVLNRMMEHEYMKLSEFK